MTVCRKPASAAISILAAGLLLACGPDNNEVHEPSVAPTASSAVPDEASADSVEPVPIFVPEEDLDLCWSPDELAAIESLEYDGSFDYEHYDTEKLNAAGEHQSECRYFLSPNAVGDEVVTSEALEDWIDVDVLADETSAHDVPDSELGRPRPEYFRDWAVERYVLEVEDSAQGLCVEGRDSVDRHCGDAGRVQSARVSFAASLGNFRISFIIYLYTPDLDRDMEAWVREVLTEITEAIISRVPTK